MSAQVAVLLSLVESLSPDALGVLVRTLPWGLQGDGRVRVTSSWHGDVRELLIDGRPVARARWGRAGVRIPREEGEQLRQERRDRSRAKARAREAAKDAVLAALLRGEEVRGHIGQQGGSLWVADSYAHRGADEGRRSSASWPGVERALGVTLERGDSDAWGYCWVRHPLVLLPDHPSEMRAEVRANARGYVHVPSESAA